MLIDFLNTNKSKKDLQIVLEVLQEFRFYEDVVENMLCKKNEWLRLEQLENYIKTILNQR
jgi:hypothetical protein